MAKASSSVAHPPGATSESTVADRPDDGIHQVVSVVGLVDVVGALSRGSLDGNFYLLDNSRAGGSVGHGTTSLQTPLDVGDLIVWICQPLECEAFARIDAVKIEARYAPYIELDCSVFSETLLVYWVARILRPLPERVPYHLMLRLGSRTDLLLPPEPSWLLPAHPAAHPAVDPEPSPHPAAAPEGGAS